MMLNPRAWLTTIENLNPAGPPTAKPALIVVTGRPGAGKTTLASALAKSIRCPLVSRDAIKEGLINTTGRADLSGVDAARVAYETFFDTISLLIGRNITTVAEAAFQHKLWAPKLEPLRSAARLRIIICNIDGDLARTRRIDRASADPARQGFHPDDLVFAPSGDDYVPPDVGVPTLTVDTTAGYEPPLDAIVSFARTQEPV